MTCGIRLAALLTSATALALCASASPATAAVTIGEDTSSAPNNAYIGCTLDPSIVCTEAQVQHPTKSYAAPFDGVIVRWRIYGFTPVTLRVLRPAGGGAYIGVGSSATEIAGGLGEKVFATSLPIHMGDLIGLNISGAGAVGVNLTAGAVFAHFNPALADGDTRAPTQSIPEALLYNADLEPDADGDGFADETQDQCVGQAGSANGCLPPPSGAAPIGQRAVAIKKCKTKFPGKAEAKKRKKCIKKAKKLPV
jgi:hypothetical protein